jgi:hypothetical protein
MGWGRKKRETKHQGTKAPRREGKEEERKKRY